MFVISFSDKNMKMAKNVMTFRLHFGLSIEYGGKFKGDVPPTLRGVCRQCRPSLPIKFEVSVTHPRNLVGIGKCDIVFLAGANM